LATLVGKSLTSLRYLLWFLFTGFAIFIQEP
jgi:hypothetical protein